MDRIAEGRLSIADLVTFWSREPGTIFVHAEIMNVLIQAVWRGDLIVALPAGHEPRAGDYRHSLLRAVAGVRTHPGLLFVRPSDDVSPTETELPDGGVLVDLRERIFWVAQSNDRSRAA